MANRTLTRLAKRNQFERFSLVRTTFDTDVPRHWVYRQQKGIENSVNRSLRRVPLFVPNDLKKKTIEQTTL